ncbi:MAG: branched-chain amino acid aminotransferase [Calditrichaceae bacterium]|nr:branched-chain amino acid aminotransferase [Calditrichaceae bacterium]MBN2710750.1 branched-chain amino acid aminotransferase [Calditrichaceae bacterium]RQV95701.1 MAG: branched-chain amino acid aminotransferase [Calditrichota bacterium]
MHKANLDWGNLSFGYMKTNCHLEYYFKDGKWSEAKVVKDDILHLHMSSTCLHYGQEAFEGMKAFTHKDGKVTVFRADENARRMVKSAEKILMQPFPEAMFLDAVKQIVKLNKEYIPPYGKGASLYIRPLLIGVSGILGVRPSDDYLFVIFVSPVGPYFKEGLKPIDLYVEEEMKRAVPGGTGDAKVGGNYAASLRVSKKVKDLGYKEVLYLDAAHNRYLDESGPANFFGITKDKKYVTPKSESILPSITNKSLMTLAKEELGMAVEQRPVDVNEIFDFAEAGCCGTAAVITPVRSITYRDKKAIYTGDETGPVCSALYKKLTAIQLGDEEDKYGWNMEIPL